MHFPELLNNLCLESIGQLFSSSGWWSVRFVGLRPAIYRVRGGMHGQILLRACTVYISDSEPDKLGSLPESSCTNPIQDNFVFHTII